MLYFNVACWCQLPSCGLNFAAHSRQTSRPRPTSQTLGLCGSIGLTGMDDPGEKETDSDSVSFYISSCWDKMEIMFCVYSCQ